MCRISVYQPKQSQKSYFAELSPLFTVMSNNGLTNKDGTGLAFLMGQDSKILKSADPAQKFFLSREFHEFISTWSGGVPILGHVRIATTGEKIADNSHPFVCGNIIGLHNGHFSNWQAIKSKYNFTGEVDSHIFYLRLAQIAGNNVLTLDHIKTCLDEFIGGYALAFYDQLGDNIWLVPGSNDLYLHDLGFGYLINTTDLSEEVTASLINLQISFPTNFTAHEVKATKLSSYKAFNLTVNGVQEVGAIIQKAETKNYGTTYYYGSAPGKPAYSETHVAKRINFGKVIGLAQKKLDFVEKWGFGVIGAEDLIDELSGFSGRFSSWRELNESMLILLDDFVAYLYNEKGLTREAAEEKYATWIPFYTFHNNEYEEACKLFPDFAKPYFLNPLETIKEIEKSVNG